jgi:UDP-2,3-diacylglucosamine pyrophosphatase LpxH
MKAFSWLLISDLHLKDDRDPWSQNVALRDLVRDIEVRRTDFTNVQFIIVSGDLAFSGRASEYNLVTTFLDDLRKVLGVERRCVFLVPGNHDVARKTQQLSFYGARHKFDSAGNAEEFLSIAEERDSLLRRLDNFVKFDREFCADQQRQFTEDKLAYFATLSVDALPIGIAGLNSALLCGDDYDEGLLVVGDRPIIDLLEIIHSADIRLLVGVLHHPLAWLRDFDQQMIEERLVPQCDLMHRGHLHEPRVQFVSTSAAQSCLVVAAGAGYAGRDFDNSYAVISVDPTDSTCVVRTFTYQNRSGKFQATEPIAHPLKLRGSLPGDLRQLVEAISSLGTCESAVAPYLSAVLSEMMAEVPMTLDGRVIFASTQVLPRAEEAASAKATTAFLKVRNSLLAFSKDVDLPTRVRRTAAPIRQYAAHLKALADANPDFGSELERRIHQATSIVNGVASQPDTPSAIALLNQLASDNDWPALEQFARRYSTSPDATVSHKALVQLAFALAHSDEPAKQRDARDLIDHFIKPSDASLADYVLAIQICRRFDDLARATGLLVSAIERFENTLPDLLTIGYKLALETGDVSLRQKLDQWRGGNSK